MPPLQFLKSLPKVDTGNILTTMNSVSLKRILGTPLATAILLSGYGCRAPSGPVTPIPLTREELRAFFASARSPQQFWITPYNSDQGPTFKGHNRLHPEQMVALPFQSSSEPTMPLIKFDAWLGREFLALLDTTSARNWMTLRAFHAMRGVPFGPPAYRFPVVHVNEAIRGYAGVIPKLRFDNLHVESAVVCAWAARGSFTRLARDAVPTPDLIIGMDLLQSFQFVQIDYPAQRLMLSTSFPYQPDARTLLASIPYSEVGGALAVAGTVNGKQQTLIVDTVGDFAMASTNLDLSIVRQLEVGPLVFRNVEVEDAAIYNLGLPSYPRIGRQLLARFKITIDPKARLVHFERPPARRAFAVAK